MPKQNESLQDNLVSVQSLSRVQLFPTPWNTAHQASLSIINSWSLLRLLPIEMVTISSSIVPFLCLQCFPASGSFPVSQFFASGDQVLKFQLQHQSCQWIFRTDLLYNWLVWLPCSPRDYQESSSAPQFKSINSWVLSFLYGPTLTSILDYWKNHSFD